MSCRRGVARADPVDRYSNPPAATSPAPFRLTGSVTPSCQAVAAPLPSPSPGSAVACCSAVCPDFSASSRPPRRPRTAPAAPRSARSSPVCMRYARCGYSYRACGVLRLLGCEPRGGLRVEASRSLARSHSPLTHVISCDACTHDYPSMRSRADHLPRSWTSCRRSRASKRKRERRAALRRRAVRTTERPTATRCV